MHKTVLPDGLRVVAIPQKGTEAVTILVLIKTGTKDETKEINGISHFLEHMFFKGTVLRPAPTDIAGPIEAVGGIMNAYTDYDLTGYFIKVDATHLDLALDIVSDIYLNSTFPEKEIKKEKGVVIEEINMFKDNPMSHLWDLWTDLLYGDQPAGWNIAGTK